MNTTQTTTDMLKITFNFISFIDWTSGSLLWLSFIDCESKKNISLFIFDMVDYLVCWKSVYVINLNFVLCIVYVCTPLIDSK